MKIGMHSITLAVTFFVTFVSSAPSVRQGHEKCGYESCPKARPGMMNVHLLAHTHMDLGWLKTVDQYFYGTKNDNANVGVRYIFESVLDELEKDPSRRFIFVETGFFNLWWRRLSDAKKKRFDALVQSGQMEFISGGWVMNDEACVFYTNTIDQMTYGIRKLKDIFGKCGVPRIGWQIDPFGHSREYASLLAQMGMDGYFFGRVDYQDFRARKKEQQLEFIWSGSANLGKDAQIFTGILPNVYSPPRGFCFDIYCSDDALVDDPDSDEYNIKSRVDDFLIYVNETAAIYKSNNIPVTMGNDFNYQSAGHWFTNLDKLIHYANLRSEDTKVNLLYSTPSCYLKALHESGVTWPNKTDDFFPYASDPHAYWTGYFTSRPAFKYLDRYANNQLQAAKQLGVLAGPREVTEASLDVLRETLAVGQHHDAITGTAKQAVANDYVKHISIGLHSSDKYANYAFEKLLSLHPQAKVPEFVRCHTLNISACDITEKSKKFSVLAYNPQATPFHVHLRVPVVGEGWRVFDSNRVEVPAEVTKIPTGVTTLRERSSKADREVVFTADLAALGFTTYFIESDSSKKCLTHQRKEHSRDATAATCDDPGTEEMVLKGKITSAFIDCASGLLSAISWKDTKIRVNQSFYWYIGHAGNNTEFKYRASGAYIFRPQQQEPLPVADKAELVHIEKNGTIVQEVHQKFSDWLTQVIRVYDDADFVEFNWVVGSIPVADQKGKEIITRFDTELKNDGIFYTDSNGREIIQRRLNYRPTWNVNIQEPVAGNYYPVNSRIYIADPTEKVQFTMLTDRSHGGSSLREGSVELMVHRRLLYDDAFGVGEALNETYYHGHGLVVRGTHRVIVTPLDQAAQVHRQLAVATYSAPALYFAPVDSKTYMAECKTNCTALERSLPGNVQLLTLEHWNKGDQVLLRLEHFFEKNDQAGEFSKPVNFSLQAAFVRTIEDMTEMNLVATETKGNTRRFEFETEGSLEAKGLMSGHENGSTDVHGPQYYVYLTPMQIRTFLVTFSKDDTKHMVCSTH
ncbi:hypothetical protein MRX96_043588 [Rhipicephalus microplus]